jgi:hypothetical protein
MAPIYSVPVTASVSTDILVALVLLGLLVVGAVVAGMVLWRTLKRRWRLMGAHPAVRVAASAWTVASAVGSRTGRKDAGWGAPRSRRELWGAVAKAESAVEEADRAGAPVGDLPDLCRRLRDAAGDVDRLLVMGAELPVDAASSVRTQVAEVLAASANIRLAAVTATSDASAPRVSALAADADRELQCITAGVKSARSSLPHPDH